MVPRHGLADPEARLRLHRRRREGLHRRLDHDIRDRLGRDEARLQPALDIFGPVLAQMWRDLQAGLEVLGEVWTRIFDKMKDVVQKAWTSSGCSSRRSPKRSAVSRSVGCSEEHGDAVGGAVGLSAAPSLAVATRGATRSGDTVTVNVNAGVGDPVAIARQIENVLRSKDRRLGR